MLAWPNNCDVGVELTELATWVLGTVLATNCPFALYWLSALAKTEAELAPTAELVPAPPDAPAPVTPRAVAPDGLVLAPVEAYWLSALVSWLIEFAGLGAAAEVNQTSAITWVLPSVVVKLEIRPIVLPLLD